MTFVYQSSILKPCYCCLLVPRVLFCCWFLIFYIDNVKKDSFIFSFPHICMHYFLVLLHYLGLPLWLYILYLKKHYSEKTSEALSDFQWSLANTYTDTLLRTTILKKKKILLETESLASSKIPASKMEDTISL